MKTNLLFLRVGAALTAVGGLTLTALPASAIFTGPYAPANWKATVTSGGAVGTAEFDGINKPNDTLTFNFKSGSANSYIERTITIGPSQAGSVIFSWVFESLGTVGSQSAGYVVNDVYTSLITADGNPNPINSSSPVTVTINNGDTFGFRFTALATSSSEGFFDVTNFSAQPVPLETDAIPIVAGALFFGADLWAKRKFNGPPVDPKL